jgi:hypothetical protein
MLPKLLTASEGTSIQISTEFTAFGCRFLHPRILYCHVVKIYRKINQGKSYAPKNITLLEYAREVTTDNSMSYQGTLPIDWHFFLLMMLFFRILPESFRDNFQSLYVNSEIIYTISIRDRLLPHPVRFTYH